ncbi:MAG: hypothetical protein LUQ11_04785 [Methylococcaceae bacterium]|nr:hypothetical protein [Methylococcaceae bacterium]
MAMTDEQFGKLLDEANSELREKQSRLQSDYGIGTLPRWWFDQETEKLQFLDDAGNCMLDGDIIDIGSYSPTSSTWKWAWSNESVLPLLREKALPLRELETITGFTLFGSDGAFKVDEPMAWELVALSVKHLNAIGCYRAPKNNGPHTFLAIMKLNKVFQ